jgi:PAS domain S-box-containing protein
VIALGAVLARSFDVEGSAFLLAIAVGVWLAGSGLARTNQRLRDEIAERRNVEAKLRRSEALLADGQRLTHTGSWRLQLPDLSLHGSREFYRLSATNQKPRDVLVRAIRDIVHPDDRRRSNGPEHALRDKADFALEMRAVRVDGSILNVEGIARAVVDESHQLVEVAGTMMDVTQRKAAEDEIRKQAKLVDLAHDAITVRDREDRVTSWNRGTEETYGWPAAEALGRVTHDLLQTSFPIARQTIEAFMRDHGKWEGELSHVRRDGTTVIVASRWSLQPDESGAPVATMEINRDITDRKQAEEALRSAQSDLAHVTRMTTIGEITTSFAHEVNQPLAAIANNTNACLTLLPDGDPALDEVRAALGDILSDANRASAIIERVRVLATKAPSEKMLLRLHDLVNDVVALAANELASRRVTIRTEVGADLPEVWGDRVQLQQVLLNLIVNAMDAMNTTPEQHRLLTIRGREDVHHGASAATISVQDCGGGFSGVRWSGSSKRSQHQAAWHGDPGWPSVDRSSTARWSTGRKPIQVRGATFSFTVPARELPGEA